MEALEFQVYMRWNAQRGDKFAEFIQTALPGTENQFNY
jgi:hypothetical protein